MIAIFKTYLKFKTQIPKLTLHFDNLLTQGTWNFDPEDCDTIVRSYSEEPVALKVTTILKSHNFNCETLE
ncbi:MAG: hypothetical protein R2797_04855 [Gelidibacter sp.]